jgi:hypothetical protein
MTARKKYTQADLRALEEIKSKLRSRVYNEYSSASAKPQNDLGECKKKAAKELTKTIEDAVFAAVGKKFGLKRVLSCKVGSSKYDHTLHQVQLGFGVNIDTDSVDEIQRELDELTRVRDDKYKQIEDWEIEALQFVAARKGEDGTAYFPSIPNI